VTVVRVPLPPQRRLLGKGPPMVACSQGTADYPASDAVMRVDWFRYWKE